MTMAEKKVAATLKEIDKLKKSKDTHEKRLEKKIAKCEKLGCNWSDEEWYEIRDTIPMGEKVSAWLDKVGEIREIEDLTKRIERAEKRLEKETGNADSEKIARAESERIEKIESKMIATLTDEERKENYEKWLKEFKAECLKDGVVIDKADYFRVSGTTKSGKSFVLDLNSGYTERSNHCYSLWINGETVFTSGTFETGYRIIKR